LRRDEKSMSALVPAGPMMEGLSMTKQIVARFLAARVLLAVGISLSLDGLLLVPLPVSAQEITEAFVRGTDVELHTYPSTDAGVVTTLQLGDAIRITGDAETEAGETKPVTVDTLGVTRVWFVPVEVVETGDAGWIAELYIDPHRLNASNPAAPPAPENTPTPTVIPAPTATHVPTATPTATAMKVPTAAPTATATQLPTSTPIATATQVPTATPGMTATQPAQIQGAVDLAIASNALESCDDGIASSITVQGAEDAGDANFTTETRYIVETTACGSGVSLMAGCGAPVEGLQEEAALIACLVYVGNEGQSSGISVAAQDFSLLSNSDNFAASSELSKQVLLPEHDIASEPLEVPYNQEASGLVVFEVPTDVAQEDMVLQWTRDRPVTTVQGELPGLQIIVHDREPVLTEVLSVMLGTPVAPQGEGSSITDLSFRGTSDDVIGPLDLEPGLYQVWARFTGDENFVIWVRQGDGTSDLLVNEIGSYSGESTFSVETSTQVVLEVEGIGPWEVQIEKLM
jgi:hypothetical protein